MSGIDNGPIGINALDSFRKGKSLLTSPRRKIAVDNHQSEQGRDRPGEPRCEAGAGNSRMVQRAVERAKAGDAEGLHFLYVRYAPDVQRYVASFVHDHHEAEDITQNVFAKLMTAIGKYEQRDVPFTAWILRVARNAALDHMRARRAVPTEEVRVADVGKAQIGQERGRALRSALERLPTEQREVLVLRHITGLSPIEIASALDKSESAVHGLHHRGRRALRASLVELGAAPVVAQA
jgi:RNA polymerase sigma-70 factor (ECF subfamily)